MAYRDIEFSDKFAKCDLESANGNQDEFVLEQVLGLTSSSTHALGLNPINGHVAFPAACMLVLLDPKTNEQKFVESPSLRYISSVNFSEDGKYLAFGEHGIKPYVMVWLTREHREYNRFVVDNSVGIKAIQFHPKSLFIVVLGCNDLNIGVWDFVRGRRLALTKWQTSPLSLTIPRPGSYVVVCGHRKVTLFKIDSVQSNSHETNVFQDRKAVLLGRQSEYTFVDITSGRNKHEREVYTVTSCGFLCEIKMGDIIIDKAIKVDAHAYCVRYGAGHIFVGCTNGAVKICNPDSLSVEASVSISSLVGPDSMMKLGARRYPDTAAIVVNERDSIVTCISSDYTVQSWQFNPEGEKMVCSAIVPVSKYSRKSGSYESCIKEQFKRESLLRSFLGFGERVKGSKMHDMPNATDVFGAHHGSYVKVPKTRFQHANAIKFSPDGKEVVCGNEEGEIKVYDAATGVLRRVIEAHSSHVTCIELMYDETHKLVCSGGRDRIIFVLNANTDFSLVQVLCDHSAAITALSLTHNNGLLTLVSAAADNVILIRRSIPGKTLKFTITGEIAEASHNKSFNLTSEYIVTGSGLSGIKLWKADPVFSGKPTKTIKCDQKGCAASRAIGIDPSGSFLAVTQIPGQITVYHLQTGQAVGSLTSQSDVTSVKFTNDLRYLISSTSNGCALVWRLPERMTDFMRTKQERAFQIEVTRDMPGEDYVSCDDSPLKNYTDSSSEYRHEDVTPSIESLSLLKLCRDMEGSSQDDDTLRSSVSCLSCSTCLESCSDTVFSMQTSESGSFIKTVPIRIPAVPGHNIEESMCTRLGMFKYVTPTEGNGLPDMFTYKSRTVKTPPRCAGDSEQRGAVVDFSKNNGKVGPSQTRSAALFAETPLTDDIEPFVSSEVCMKHKIYSSSIGQICPDSATTNASRIKKVPSASPTKSTRQSLLTSLASGTTTFATFDSSVAKGYMSSRCGSPLTSTGAEFFHSYTSCTTYQCPYYTSSNYTNNDQAGVNETRLKAQEMATPSSNDHNKSYGDTSSQGICNSGIKKRDSVENAARWPSCEEDTNPGFSNSLKITDSTDLSSTHLDVYRDFFENMKVDETVILVKAGDKSTEEQSEGVRSKLAHCTSDEDKNDDCNQVNDIILVDGLEPANGYDAMTEQAKPEDVNLEESRTAVHVKLEESRTAEQATLEESQTLEQTLTNKNVSVVDTEQWEPQAAECGLSGDKPHTAGVNLPEIKVVLDVRQNETVHGVNKSCTQLVDIKCEDLSGKSPLYDCSDDGSVFNYHSITRDAQGRLRWLGRRSTENSFTTDDDRSIPDSSRNAQELQLPQSASPKFTLNSPWNIKCSRCSTKTCLGQGSPDMSIVSLDSRELVSPDSGKESTYSRQNYSEESGEFLDVDQLKMIGKRHGCYVADQKNTSDACNLLLNASAFLENQKNVPRQYIRDLLHKWQEELKQCLQLSNSQETFHRFYSDIDDAELVELLTLALESNHTQAPPFPDSPYKWRAAEREEMPRASDDNAGDLPKTRQSSALAKLLKLLIMNDGRGAEANSDNQGGESPSVQELVCFLDRAVNERRMLRGSPPKPIRKRCEGESQNPETPQQPNSSGRYGSSQTSPGCKFYESSYDGGAHMRHLGLKHDRHRDDIDGTDDGLERRRTCDAAGPPRFEQGSTHILVSEASERKRRDEREPSTIRRPSSEGNVKKSPVGLPQTLDSSPKTDCALKSGGALSSLPPPCDSLQKDGVSGSSTPTPREKGEDFGAIIRDRAMDMPVFDSGESWRLHQYHHKGGLSAEPIFKTSTQSIVEVFQDQDEYLRKLKEARVKFEESIRALSNERKFRKAKSESTG